MYTCTYIYIYIWERDQETHIREGERQRASFKERKKIEGVLLHKCKMSVLGNYAKVLHSADTFRPHRLDRKLGQESTLLRSPV